jgi:hypothetical protein
VKYTDPNGKWVKNNTEHAIAVRTEKGKYELVAPGGTHDGKVDGVIMQNGLTFKVSDSDIFNEDIDIEVGGSEDGKSYCYTFTLPNEKSVKQNKFGDILKNLAFKKDLSGIITQDDTKRDAQKWYAQATLPKKDDGLGDPSTWDAQAASQNQNEQSVPKNDPPPPKGEET